MGIIGRLFGGPTAAEREQVIAYLIREWRIRAIQDDEAAQYNAALTRLGGAPESEIDAAHAVAAAARRMAKMNQQLVTEHVHVGPVPDSAGRCYFAWHSTYLALAEWSDAVAEISESLVNGGHPIMERAQVLHSVQEKARRASEKEEAKLLRYIKIRAEEARSIMVEAEGGTHGR